MKHVVIRNFEDFLMQILTIGNENDGLLGGIIVNVNDDGSPKTYQKDNKTFIEVIGKFPVSLLFRGQDSDYPLIPKLARILKGGNIATKEQNFITELKRRSNKIVNSNFGNWDLLVYGQHYGLATRLLDWTTNPLVALWFACMTEDKSKNSFVYLLKQTEEDTLDIAKEESPFTIKNTKILKPNLNNERIVAQNGWFTIHAINEATGKFIPLDEDKQFENNLWKFEIPAIQKELILLKLNILGINYESIYPGIEGTCKFINYACK